MGLDDLIDVIIDIRDLADFLPRRRSRGKAFVPQLDNLPLTEARDALMRCELRMKVMGRRKNDKEFSGVVTFQDPKAGSRVAPGTVVKVRVKAPPLEVG